MRKTKREMVMERRYERNKPPEVTVDLDGLFRILLGGEFNPTQRRCSYSKSRIKAYMGAAGVAKTSTLVASGIARCLLQSNCHGLIARYDYNDLQDTTMRRFEEMLSRLPPGVVLDRNKSPPAKWWLQPMVEGATPSQITFMGLKDAIGSYEFNWAGVDEADEVDEYRVHEINTRLRNPGGNYSLLMCFNPPQKDHWLYTACTGLNGMDRKVADPWVDEMFLPLPGENDRNLPENYHADLAKSLPEDMVTRLIKGEWGASFGDSPVYRQFSAKFHCTEKLPIYSEQPLIHWWDFGYNNPRCIVMQIDPDDGGFNVLQTITGHREEIEPFARRCTVEINANYPQCQRRIDYGDPAVTQRKDTGSALAILRKLGIILIHRQSHILDGVRLVRMALERVVQGKPFIRILKSRNASLIRALGGGYQMDKHGQMPIKDGVYDHDADAFRYGIVNMMMPNGEPRPTVYSVGIQKDGQPAPQQFGRQASLAYDRTFDIR